MTKMGERHHSDVWYDGSSKQSGGGQASISQRHLGLLMRMLSEEEEFIDFGDTTFAISR